MEKPKNIVVVLQAEMPYWWEKSEENWHSGLSWQEIYGISNNHSTQSWWTHSVGTCSAKLDSWRFGNLWVCLWYFVFVVHFLKSACLLLLTRFGFVWSWKNKEKYLTYTWRQQFSKRGNKLWLLKTVSLVHWWAPTENFYDQCPDITANWQQYTKRHISWD